MTYDVFICYESTTGKDYAENLKRALERDRHKAFLADTTLISGDDWKKEISSALNGCKYFIVIITALTMNSELVKKEYKKAMSLGKRIIPCRYSKIEISETKELEVPQQLEFENKSELANKVILEIRKISKEEERGVKTKEDPEEFLRRGNLLFNLGKVNEAFKAFDKAIELKPDYAPAWYNKGVVLGEKLNRPNEALKAFDKAIDLKPDYAEAWYNKGVVLGELKRPDKELNAYNKAIELKPDYAGAWINKGILLGKLGRPDEALKAYDKAIEIKPDFAVAWYNRGVVLGKKLNRLDEALEAFDKAIEIKPDFAMAWYNRACIYSLMGNKENALRDLSKAIELDTQCKEMAKKNEGFKGLWNDEDFKKIVS